jgi:hypothetical protein
MVPEFQFKNKLQIQTLKIAEAASGHGQNFRMAPATVSMSKGSKVAEKKLNFEIFVNEKVKKFEYL